MLPSPPMSVASYRVGRLRAEVTVDGRHVCVERSEEGGLYPRKRPEEPKATCTITIVETKARA